MRPLGTVWTEMRHHEQRARELGAENSRAQMAWLNRFFADVAVEAASHDRSAAAQARAQVAIGEFILAIGGA